MSLPTLRKLSSVQTLEDVKKVVADIQFNFDLLAKAPRLVAVNPAAGVIKFLTIESDGTWNEWQILAGAGCGFTQDNVARTLTVHVP